VGWPLIVSALVGAVTMVLGCGFIFPLGSAASGVCDLTAIASGMVFFGLLDGQCPKSTWNACRAAAATTASARNRQEVILLSHLIGMRSQQIQSQRAASASSVAAGVLVCPASVASRLLLLIGYPSYLAAPTFLAYPIALE
jgi:hypothetical protein